MGSKEAKAWGVEPDIKIVSQKKVTQKKAPVNYIYLYLNDYSNKNSLKIFPYGNQH